MQSLALTLCGRALAFVRAQLSVVGRSLAVVCNSVSLIGDAFSFVSDPLAPGELGRTAREHLIALIGLSIEFALSLVVDRVLNDHDLL